MLESEVMKLSLADFFLPDSDDPLVPPNDFSAWLEGGRRAMSLYEPTLLEGPTPRTTLSTPDGPSKVINMASYNYLGLARRPEVVEAACAALTKYGTGACGSPLYSGMTDLHRQLEAELSSFLGREQTILFNSGFAGALGTLAGMLRKGDVAVLDAKCHVCLVEGARLAGARLEFFDHNVASSLEDALARHGSCRRLVVLEGVYSMDGDIGDLPTLLPIARDHGVGVMIDEAHSVLLFGATGRGVTEHFHSDVAVPIKYGTFSKAFAGIGGFVSGPAELLNYLRVYASSYGFSCALPPAVVGSLLAALGVARREPELRARTLENAAYFRSQLQGMGVDTGASTTQVVPVVIGSDRALLYELGLELRRRGLFLAPVDYPAAAEDELRFRASITAGHTRADLDEALNILADVVAPRVKGRC
jgi:7-keto-8-aminopelargonate synthetase-like enzyme